MPEYTFPFDTCETPRPSGIAQPWSALINVVNCLVILYFLLRSKTPPVFLVLLSFFMFEAFHTFSHIKHIQGNIQIYIVHILAYFANFSFAWYAYNRALRIPSTAFCLWYLALISMDLYAFIYLPLFVYILTQATMFLSTLSYYYKDFTRVLRERIPWIMLVSFITVGLVTNESYHCTRMLATIPHFPFHIFIELSGLVLLCLISRGISE